MNTIRVQNVEAGTTVRHNGRDVVVVRALRISADRFRLEFADGTFRVCSWGAVVTLAR